MCSHGCGTRDQEKKAPAKWTSFAFKGAVGLR